MTDVHEGTRFLRVRTTIVLGALSAVGPFSLDAYLPAMPTIARQFAVSAGSVQWSLTACLVGLALGQLFVGPIADRVGRRGPLIAGTIAYALASLCCAFAPNISLLVLARFIQGVAGAAGIVVGRAMVRDLTSGNSSTALYSQLAAVSGIAPVVAPVFGALALQFVSWRAVFVGLAVLGLCLVASVLLWMPESHTSDARSKLPQEPFWKSFGKVMQDPYFAGFALLGGLATGTLFAYISNASFVVQTTYQGSSLEFATIFAINGAGLALASQLNSRLSRRFGSVRLLRIGLALQVVGVLTLATVVLLIGRSRGLNALTLAPFLFFAIVPWGLVMPNVTGLAMARSARRNGTASAILGVVGFLAGATVSSAGGLIDPEHSMVLLMLVTVTFSAILAILLTRTRSRSSFADRTE